MELVKHVKRMRGVTGGQREKVLQLGTRSFVLQKAWHHCGVIANKVQVDDQEVLETGQLEPYLQRVG